MRASELKKNSFCNASASTSDGIKKVRIMVNENTWCNGFLAKCSPSSLVKNIKCNRS